MPKKLPFTKDDYFKMLDKFLVVPEAQPNSIAGKLRQSIQKIGLLRRPK